MKSVTIIMTMAALLLISCSSSALRAGEAPPNDPAWPFNSEQKMDQAIVKYASDPLATYYVIMRAWEINKSAEATLVYRSLLQNKPNDPYLESAYGFSQMMSNSCLAHDFMIANPAPVVAKVRALQAEANYDADQAYWAKPNDPYVLLERGIEIGYRFNGYGKEDEAMECLRRVVALKPKWDVAHFWFADSLSNAALMGLGCTSQTVSDQRNNESLREYAIAIKLNPALKAKALMREVGPYSQMLQYKNALHCIDIAMATDPSLATKPRVIAERASFAKLAEKPGSK